MCDLMKKRFLWNYFLVKNFKDNDNQNIEPRELSSLYIPYWSRRGCFLYCTWDQISHYPTVGTFPYHSHDKASLHLGWWCTTHEVQVKNVCFFQSLRIRQKAERSSTHLNHTCRKEVVMVTSAEQGTPWKLVWIHKHN